MRGFVSIYFDPKSTTKPTTIVKNIANVNNVEFAYLITGEVDAIASVNTQDTDDFRDTVVAIRRVTGVMRTSTSVVL